MRVVLADLKGLRGFVSKDTVAAGYGSRLQPFTRVTQVICQLKRRLHDPPSVQLAYLAAIAADAGHEVIFTTTDEVVNGDVAVILSSLVDYRHEAAWADDMRAHGVRVGFVGLAASKMPELFADHADFIITGEPEEAFSRLMQGEQLSGVVASKEIDDLDVLPFPRWDLLTTGLRRTRGVPGSVRPLHGGFPLLASRSCPEFCTYCPHRILSTYRVRSVRSIADELQHLCERVRFALRHLPGSAVQPGPGPRPRALRHDRSARADAAVRMRNPPRPTRHRPARSDARRGLCGP